jgi:hypothetical protein
LSSSRARIVQSILLLILLAGVAASRIHTREQYVTGLDPGNYLLGMQDYSIAAERPHPPGYPVYVALCRGVAAIAGEDHLAIIIVQVFFSVLAVAFLYLLVRRKLGHSHAMLAAIFLAVNPLFWLYGSTAENYAFDAMIAPLTILLMLATRRWWWLATGLLFGLAAGMRATSLLLLAPVALYILYARYRRAELSGADLLRLGGGALAGILAWLPATIVNEGGIAGYLKAATALSMTAAGHFGGNLGGFIITLLWMMNLSLFYLIGCSVRLIRTFGAGWRTTFSLSKILLLWILPPLLFFALVIQTKGYMLLILPGFSMLIAWCLLRERSLTSKVIDSTLVVVAHLAFFILVPYLEPPEFLALAPRQRTPEQRVLSVLGRAFSAYLPSYSRIKTLDREVELSLRSMRFAIGEGGDSTLVVVDPSARQFIVARVLQYYMPDVGFAEPSIRRDSVVVYYKGIGRQERRTPDSAFTAPRLLLVTDRRLVSRYEPTDLVPIVSSPQIAILEIRKGSEVRTRRRMEELFVR